MPITQYLRPYASICLLMMALYLGLTTTDTLHAQVNCASPIQLSTGLSEYLYDIDSNLAVWVEDDEGDGEIWMFDFASQKTTRLTDNTTHEDGFAVKNGVVVMSIQTPQGYEIFLYNSTTKSTTQIINNTVEEMDLYTDGVSVVWIADDGFDNEIYHYNIKTGVTTRITENTADDYSPLVSGQYIVWTRYNGYDAEVFRYDFSTGKIKQLSDSPYGDSSVQDIDGNHVVWTSFDGEDTEIHAYNLLTKQAVQITDNTLDDESPILNGRYVTWQYFDGADGEIMLYDLQTGASLPITNNTIADWNPSIHGDVLVWEGGDWEDYKVYSYDLSDNTSSMLAPVEAWNNRPLTHNRLVVWQSGIFFDPVKGDVAELYLADCRGTSTTPTVEPTDEVIPTVTAQVTPTEVPTNGTVELLLNAGFEEQSYEVWKLTNSSHDCLRCNKPGKTIAFTGDCAFRFKGGLEEKSKLSQKVDLTGKAFNSGDALELSLQLNAPTASSGVIKLRVKYSDGTVPGKITEVFGATSGYTEVRYPHTLSSPNVSKIKVIFVNTSMEGRLLIDDFSLKHHTGSTTMGLIPLP